MSTRRSVLAGLATVATGVIGGVGLAAESEAKRSHPRRYRHRQNKRRARQRRRK